MLSVMSYLVKHTWTQNTSYISDCTKAVLKRATASSQKSGCRHTLTLANNYKCLRGHRGTFEYWGSKNSSKHRKQTVTHPQEWCMWSISTKIRNLNCNTVNSNRHQNVCVFKTQLKQAGSICRTSAGECDLTEYCTGASEECPEDSFEMNGKPCYNQAAGYCHDGQCPTHEHHCWRLFGPGNPTELYFRHLHQHHTGNPKPSIS